MEVIDNLEIYIENMEFVSISTAYEDNNGDIVVTTIPSMNPTSKQIFVNYHWFRQHYGKSFLIWKIEPEHQKAGICTESLQGEF